jgi:hypothetical protein
MEEDENKNTEARETDEEVQAAEDDMNFIQEFIDRKKLENRVLREIIENLNHTENHDKPIDKKQ